ncbi:MAG: ATP-binding protein [Deltaproteobacteria bacterium]|jgi:MinD superfamily P-loop ATPase|nr:ATP-binding protein [Deltaproteobacteria bacterium]
MKELVILSGKGGTGKTSLTAAFASIAENSVLCDADVDAADLHLLMNPVVRERMEFMGGNLAAIDPGRCSQCGQCIDLCRFDAISSDFVVDEIDCEGCGVCVDFCPEQAIDFPINKCGEWYISETRFGPMVHARLGIAEENSGKLVTLVRQEAGKLAESTKRELIITDGPPGVGCPVIASVGGATALLVVTEPTVSGVHDMQRLLDLAAYFKVPSMVCVNKYDLNPEQSAAIKELADEKGIPYVGNIPFDPQFVESMVAGKTVLEHRPDGELGAIVKQVWASVQGEMNIN